MTVSYGDWARFSGCKEGEFEDLQLFNSIHIQFDFFFYYLLGKLFWGIRNDGPRPKAPPPPHHQTNKQTHTQQQQTTKTNTPILNIKTTAIMQEWRVEGIHIEKEMSWYR